MVAVRVLSTAVKRTDAKNFILALVKARMDVTHNISWFPKEAWTFTIFGSKDSLNFILGKSFVTWVRVDI